MLASAARTHLAARTVSHAGAGARRAASSIALKYANAAYNAALSQSPQVLTKVQSELTAILAGIHSTPQVADFVNNPTLSVDDRKAGLQALFVSAAGQGGKKESVSEITRNLFEVMAENGRLVETPGVVEGFTELVSKYRGELEVVVTSERPIPGDLMRRLEASLKASQAAQKAKSLKITNKVNPAILGGLVLDFGDKTIDLSVSSRVNKMNSLLQESV